MNRIEEAALNLRDGHAVEENAAVLWGYLEPRVRGFFLARGLSRDSSQELTQEVFMQLFRSINRFRFEASIETWAFFIAGNIWRKTLRASAALKGQGQQVPIKDEEDQDGFIHPARIELIGTADDPLSSVLSRERQLILQESIAKLPSAMRRCVELRYGRELTTREIATILEISRTAVKANLHEARRRLREIVIQDWHDDLRVEGIPGEESITIGPGINGKLSPIVAGLIQACDAELVTWLRKHPEDFYQIHPGTFERIIAEIFDSEGFQVESVSSWNQPDGGVDLIAAKKVTSSMDIRLAVQCKRFKRERRVSAEPIRSLAGVLDRFRAHAGVIATTSYFTEEAQEEARRHFWKISLRDYDNILHSLRTFSGFELQPTGLWLLRGSGVD